MAIYGQFIGDVLLKFLILLLKIDHCIGSLNFRPDAYYREKYKRVRLHRLHRRDVLLAPKDAAN